MAITDVDASDFAAACDGWAERIEVNKPRACLLAAEYLKGEAQELTPVETGNLRGSADARPDGDGAEVFYPGPYARFQHYGLDLHHEEGQALYLEQAMVANAGRAFDVMAQALT